MTNFVNPLGLNTAVDVFRIFINQKTISQLLGFHPALVILIYSLLNSNFGETSIVMDTYVKYPPRPMQSDVYTGPMIISRFRTIEQAKALMKKKDIDLTELDELNNSYNKGKVNT